MKLTIKFALLLALSTSVAFAEGDMGSGGGNDDPGDGEENCTTLSCPPEEPGDGGENDGGDSGDSLLTFVQKYLNSLFG